MNIEELKKVHDEREAKIREIAILTKDADFYIVFLFDLFASIFSECALTTAINQMWQDKTACSMIEKSWAEIKKELRAEIKEKINFMRIDINYLNDDLIWKIDEENLSIFYKFSHHAEDDHDADSVQNSFVKIPCKFLTKENIEILQRKKNEFDEAVKVIKKDSKTKEKSVLLIQKKKQFDALKKELAVLEKEQL